MNAAGFFAVMQPARESKAIMILWEPTNHPRSTGSCGVVDKTCSTSAIAPTPVVRLSEAWFRWCLAAPSWLMRRSSSQT